MKQKAVDDESPNDSPMTRKGPDGRAHETTEMEERARDAQKSEHKDDRPKTPTVPLRGPPD
jgi:hypothetical protein